MVGVAVAQVELAGAQVGGFQVGGRAGVAVEHLVVGAQQRAADALALPVRPDGEDGQVVVGGAGRVVPVERCVEGQEPAGPGAGRGGEPVGVAGGRPGGAVGRRGATAPTAARSAVVWTTPLASACST